MPLIKRYSNRKLYDTESKRYVTLEDIASTVRRGEEIQVVDHVTGEDITSVILFQVIFEEEKKISGLLPQVFLSRLIRAGGGAVNTVRNRLASIDPFQVVDEEIRRRVQVLVKQEQLSEEEGRRMVDLLTRRPAGAVHIPVKGEDELESASLNEPNFEPETDPSPVEFDLLQRQVEMLEQELQRLKQTRQAG